jgi:hypothetical protein
MMWAFNVLPDLDEHVSIFRDAHPNFDFCPAYALR